MIIKALHNWIVNHDSLKESSCSNNCIKIEVDRGNEKVFVTKLYSLLHIEDLYDDMVKLPYVVVSYEAIYSNWNLIISKSKLCGFFPPQVQLMSNQRRYFVNVRVVFYQHQYKLLQMHEDWDILLFVNSYLNL